MPKKFKRIRRFRIRTVRTKGRGRKSRVSIPKLLVSNVGIHYFKRTVSIPVSQGGVTFVDVKTGGNSNQVLTYDTTNGAWVIGTGNAGLNNCTYYSMGVKFQLAQLQSIADFTSLFDYYKINKIKLKITPYSTAANLQDGQGAGVSNQNLAVQYWNIIDKDDSDAFGADLAGIQLMQQYDTLRSGNFFAGNGRPIKRYFTPSIAQQVYAGGAITPAYEVARPKWLDLARQDHDHYGYKMLFQVFCPNSIITSYIWFKMEATFYLAMKGVR